ncbi:MAG: TraR/DksA C4-type zinc finger protein [Sporomusaceae bacterium]|nr:TraR/DksA C4-type zinc finger protein [Sporomusaceae bacterium]
MDHHALIKERLLKSQEALLQTASRLEETGLGDTLADSLGELSLYDNHPGDIGDELFERSKDLALRDNEALELREIEAALARLEQGTYGICERCQEKIEPERLEALPTAARCIRCQHEIDVIDTTPRPLEEELLMPPFGRTFLDHDSDENVGFDGEDALQAVLKFGSSDTPQDVSGTRTFDVWPDNEEKAGLVEATDAIPASIDGKRNHSNEPNQS